MTLSQPSGRAPLTTEAREARKMEMREKRCIFDGIVVFEKLRCWSVCLLRNSTRGFGREKSLGEHT